ncbi:MAG: hypothetical protein WBN96_07240 [Gammaproteobacteria bacterium]
MITYELNFARINLIRDDIAEVIIHDGIELNVAMVNEYHDFLITHLTPPFSLLINKVNSYTYDFDAQQTLATIEHIKAMAVVAYKRSAVITTEYLASQPREKQWNLQIFSDRESAMHWLTTVQDSRRHLPETTA